MKILFSGASSFTGYWFCRTLARAGHDVTALFRRTSAEQYEGTRGDRVKGLHTFCRCQFSLTFGSQKFLELAKSEPWDVYCHHAADVTNYRSPDFDPLTATSSNTENLRPVLKSLNDGGCERIVYTGSIFEGGEGSGSDDLPHISAYGLSKSLTWEVFRHRCYEQSLKLQKFVIPNPFGPKEEPRFTNFLVQQWKQGKTPEVRTPLYVRDNIHVSLLALDYSAFLEGRWPNDKHSPSGYIESQGQFALRFAREFRKRTGWECPVGLAEQSDFPEPLIRVNTQPSAPSHPEWQESNAWDELVKFYQD